MVDYGSQLASKEIKKEVIRKIIYHMADMISVGTKVVGTTNLDALDVKFNYPSEMTAKYPVGDTAVAPRETITWSEFKAALAKGQVHYMITDVAKLRAVAGTQNTIMARRASEAMAKQIDEEILDVLHGGAGESVAAGGVWTSASTDIEADVVSAWNKLLETSNVTEQELMRGVSLVVPVEAFKYVNKLTLIGNVQQTLRAYLKTVYNMNIFVTRSEQLGTSASTDALMLVPGGMTAQHGVLSAGAARAANVPLVERERIIGSGDDYLVSRWWKTIIIEDGSASGQTDRIVKITDVCT